MQPVPSMSPRKAKLARFEALMKRLTIRPAQEQSQTNLQTELNEQMSDIFNKRCSVNKKSVPTTKDAAEI